jgi:hypothetical protein
MAKGVLKLDQNKKSVRIDGLLLEQRLIFEYFDKQPEKEREPLLVRALLLGVLALMEDRLSAFLAKTSNTLGTELEHLKYILDLNTELFYRTTMKGRDAEQDLVDQLGSYARQRGYADEVVHTGDVTGALPKNKSGDIRITIDNDKECAIVIESKFDKAKRIGGFADKDPLSKGDTAIGQLLEAGANREAAAAIIVFDASMVDGRLAAEVGGAKYFPGCGFITIVDSARGDFATLFLCYDLARSLALARRRNNAKEDDVLPLIVGRFLHDVNSFLALKKQLLDSIEGHRKMLQTIEGSMLSLEFTKEIFNRFLQDGGLSKEQLVDFYQAEPVKSRYSELVKELDGALKG